MVILKRVWSFLVRLWWKMNYWEIKDKDGNVIYRDKL
jgi:hypothetical protein